MSVPVKIKPLGLLDILNFLNQVRVREKAIARAPSIPLPQEHAVNRSARLLHPEEQLLRITDVIPQAPNIKTFMFSSADEQPLAYFRAGQYLSVRLFIGGSVVTRPFSLCSAPSEALDGHYAITVKRAGFATGYMLDTWKVGDTVLASAPLGQFYYTRLRDAEHMIGLAGGSGVTPFLSMALAILNGEEAFRLTLLYGSRTQNDILFRDVLDECVRRGDGRIKVVHVLSDETAPGCESGLLTAELIQKYAGEGPYSLFICGPQGMYDFVNKEIASLGKERKWVRREILSASKAPWNLPGYPSEKKGKTFTVTVRQCGREYTCPAGADESLLVALERAGLRALSHCRGGECGWCRSRLLQGDVFIPESTDGRRAADKLYGYIHPCVSYPTSDLVIDIPGA